MQASCADFRGADSEERLRYGEAEGGAGPDGGRLFIQEDDGDRYILRSSWVDRACSRRPSQSRVGDHRVRAGWSSVCPGTDRLGAAGKRLNVRRILFIGDVHATPEDLGDCDALFELVRQVSSQEEVDEICLLGDSYNTHNVIRVEVLAFWRRTFSTLTGPVRVLVGNHDLSSESGNPEIHALIAHRDQVTVIDKPVLDRGVLYSPYFSDRERFVKECNQLGGTTLVCHATFEGAKYDNGFFAPDGVDPQSLIHKYVISGHIHTPAAFDKVTYIGAPRWRTLSDANIERAIWLYDFDDSGEILGARSFDTGGVCRQIRFATDTPDEPVTLPLLGNVDWRLDIRGPAAWVDERKKLLAGPGVRLRTFVTTTAAPKVRESDGIAVAFDSYLRKFVPRFGTDPGTLRDLAKKRLHV